MSDLDELYQSVILEHDKRPRNFRPMDGPHLEAEGYNPLCGDRVTVMLRVDDGRIADVSFQGSGCAISKASASMMTEQLKGLPVADAERLFDTFRNELTGSPADDATLPAKLGVFRGVRAFPMRVKCATLAWHAMHAALESAQSRAQSDEVEGRGRGGSTKERERE